MSDFNQLDYEREFAAAQQLCNYFKQWASLSSNDVKTVLAQQNEQELGHLMRLLDSLRAKINSELYNVRGLKYDSYIPRIGDIVESKMNIGQQYEIEALYPEIHLIPLPKISDIFHACTNTRLLQLIERPTNQRKPSKPYSRKVNFTHATKE